MDYSKLPKLNLKIVALVVVLGVLAAIGIYEARLNGLIPQFDVNIPKPEAIKTQTVVREENAVISVIENASPSVVTIVSVGDKNENSIIGTGFIIDSKGLVVSAKNNISDAGRYAITTKENQKYDVLKIYKDPGLDLCVMQVNATNLKALNLSDSSKIRLGQTAIAVGRSAGANTNTASVGVIAGSGNLIKTDAVINPENAGGPLLSSAGQVLGVNTVVSDVWQGFGFAIPADAVKQVLNNFLNTSTKAFLGIKYKFISNPQGVAVQEVATSGPADAAGIKTNDIITKINGITVATENTVLDVIAGSKPGQQIELTFLRDGQEKKMSVVLTIVPNK